MSNRANAKRTKMKIRMRMRTDLIAFYVCIRHPAGLFFDVRNSSGGIISLKWNNYTDKLNTIARSVTIVSINAAKATPSLF